MMTHNYLIAAKTEATRGGSDIDETKRNRCLHYLQCKWKSGKINQIIFNSEYFKKCVDAL